jgi:hypothetical protein
MDANRFDRLTKSLSAVRTRRGMLHLLTALPLASAVAAVLGEETAAKGRRQKRKDRHHQDQDKRQTQRHQKHTQRGQAKRQQQKRRAQRQDPAPPPAPGCTPTTCAAQGTNCGTIADGCGTQIRCGPDSCGAGYSCIDNVCRCADGTAVCPPGGSSPTCCQSGQVCKDGNGPCCTPLAACPDGKNCGTMSDGCGSQIRCEPDSCGDGDTCCSGQCVNLNLQTDANHCGSCTNACLQNETCLSGACHFCTDDVCFRTCSGPTSCYTRSGGCAYPNACVKTASDHLVCFGHYVLGSTCDEDADCVSGQVCGTDVGSDPVCEEYANRCMRPD